MIKEILGNVNPRTVKLIIGLGNPGNKYQNTYHNIGFLFLDYLLKKNNKEKTSKKWRRLKNFEYAKINDLYLVKNSNFMNQSGGSAAEALKYLNCSLQEILVVHDDSDIQTGEYKISFGRGSAGHQGVESVIKNLKTKNFWRLRIGIRPSQKLRIKAGEFVLKTIGHVDKKEFNLLFKYLSKNIQGLMENDKENE